jgi:hypothetical protein
MDGLLTYFLFSYYKHIIIIKQLRHSHVLGVIQENTVQDIMMEQYRPTGIIIWNGMWIYINIDVQVIVLSTAMVILEDIATRQTS